MSSHAQEKSSIRERMRAIRQALDPFEVSEAGGRVAERLLAMVGPPKGIRACAYASAGKEVPTAPAIGRLLSGGGTVAVPDWEGWRGGSGLRLLRIDGAQDLATESRTVPQPRFSPDRLVPPGEVDLFLVPGLAFDGWGRRIGMGGGYFDRLLALASPRASLIGLAYDFQVLERLPSDPHDVPVGAVVTPTRTWTRAFERIQEGISP